MIGITYGAIITKPNRREKKRKNVSHVHNYHCHKTIGRATQRRLPMTHIRIEQFNDILTHAYNLQNQTICKDYVSSLAKLAICLSRDHLDFTPI